MFDCMTFCCTDQCCQYGVDLSPQERDAILAKSSHIESLIKDKISEWFGEETATEPDAEFPDGRILRTNVGFRGCVFLNPIGRGCVLHKLGLKPQVCHRTFFNLDGKTLDKDIERLPCKSLWEMHSAKV